MFTINHTLDHTALEEGKPNMCTVVVDAMHVRLSTTEGDLTIHFEFTLDEWIKFIVGTIPVDDYLNAQGLGGLLQHPVGRREAFGPEYGR